MTKVRLWDLGECGEGGYDVVSPVSDMSCWPSCCLTAIMNWYILIELQWAGILWRCTRPGVRVAGRGSTIATLRPKKFLISLALMAFGHWSEMSWCKSRMSMEDEIGYVLFPWWWRSDGDDDVHALKLGEAGNWSTSHKFEFVSPPTWGPKFQFPTINDGHHFDFGSDSR